MGPQATMARNTEGFLNVRTTLVPGVLSSQVASPSQGYTETNDRTRAHTHS